jgi:hypothetical protein
MKVRIQLATGEKFPLTINLDSTVPILIPIDTPTEIPNKKIERSAFINPINNI